MNYHEKTYKEIFEAMLQDSLDNGLISHADDFQDYIADKQDISNYYVMDKAVIATMFAKVYEDITSVYESAKVEYAENYDLDDIGKIVGVPRPEASKSSAIVTFTLQTGINEDLHIPEGFVIATTGGVEYETVEEIYIAAGDVSANVQCMSLITGLDSKAGEGELTEIISNSTYSLTCINHNRSRGGNPRYSDDEYRYLLMNWTKIYLKGSLEAFEYYFAGLDGIDDYRLVPNWDGAGSIKIIVDPGDSTTLNRLYNEIKTSICQVDDVPVMCAPIDKYISIRATVNVDIDVINPYSQLEKEEIQNRIQSAIKVFIDGGRLADGSWYPGLGLGEDFIPHKLAVFLDSEIPELKNITFTTPADYVTVLDEEQGISSDITIEMI